jgi:hypothetical protein
MIPGVSEIRCRTHRFYKFRDDFVFARGVNLMTICERNMEGKIKVVNNLTTTGIALKKNQTAMNDKKIEALF